MSINSAARKMNSIARKKFKESSREPACVHKNLTLRTLVMLKYIRPESESVFAPIVKNLVPFSKRPDKKGDYENGMGRHYYCVASPSGREQSAVNGYFKNGAGKCCKSARTMLEEDYTMALTMYIAGFHEKSAEFLGRAVHMLSDMCCIPHAASMTYFSSARSFHKSYELLAEAIYPDFVPEQRNPELPDYFSDRSSFEKDINAIAAETARGIADVMNDPLKAVTEHLLRTERILARFLIRFLDDLTAPEREAHYITTGSGCRFLRGTSPITVKVTEKGITFHGVNPSPESDINVTDRVFYAAHRHDGLFTISPVKDDSGRVLEVSDGKLVWHKFDPVHGEQLFKL